MQYFFIFIFIFIFPLSARAQREEKLHFHVLLQSQNFMNKSDSLLRKNSCSICKGFIFLEKQTPDFGKTRQAQTVGFPQGTDFLSIASATTVLTVFQILTWVGLTTNDKFRLFNGILGAGFGIGGIVFGIVGAFAVLPTLWAVVSAISFIMGFGLLVISSLNIITALSPKKRKKKDVSSSQSFYSPQKKAALFSFAF